MSTTRTSVLLAFLSLVASSRMVLMAQSTLPPNGPTQAVNVAPLNATQPQIDAATRAHRAEVSYRSGLLSVNANNSSLNQILREIGRQTGMTITGGIKDERVFGHYGPAEPAVLLGTLIDGTGTNMLLRQNGSDVPLELVLTPRGGGATPPNPNAPGFDDGDSDDNDRPNPPQQNGPPPPSGFRGNAQAPSQNPVLTNQTSVPASIPSPENNVNGSSLNVTPTASQIPVTNSVPLDSLPTPSTTPASTGVVDTPNPPNGPVVNPIQSQAAAIGAAASAAGNTGANATPTTTTTTPGTPKTPEQIFQELQQMRQRQQQSGTTTPRLNHRSAVVSRSAMSLRHPHHSRGYTFGNHRPLLRSCNGLHPEHAKHGLANAIRQQNACR